MKLSLKTILASALIFLVSACAEDPVSHDMHKDAMNSMDEAMNNPSGNPDIDFARGMVPHHEMAVDMAKKELRDGCDPEMRKLAKNILDAQKKEIGQMNRWIDKNDQ